VLDWAWQSSMQAGLHPTLKCAEAFATTDFRSEMTAFKAPTLIIHGTADKTVPIDATGRAAAQAVGTAALLEYDGAPHGVFATHTDQLISDIVSCL
jgi:non-heme chloroperoxidase